MSALSFVPIAAILIILVYGLILYNRLITMRNRCRNAWSQIDIQLKLRHDLVPRLVSAARAYAAHEKAVLENAARARSAAIYGVSVRERSHLETDLSRATAGLLSLAEAYPDLKADSLFLNLQKELSAVEDEIRFSRQFYNDTVMRFNTMAESFPAVLLAGILGFRKIPFFEISS